MRAHARSSAIERWQNRTRPARGPGDPDGSAGDGPVRRRRTGEFGQQRRRRQHVAIGGSGCATVYFVSFTTSATGGLSRANNDSITVTFPSGPTSSARWGTPRWSTSPTTTPPSGAAARPGWSRPARCSAARRSPPATKSASSSTASSTRRRRLRARPSPCPRPRTRRRPTRRRIASSRAIRSPSRR